MSLNFRMDGKNIPMVVYKSSFGLPGSKPEGITGLLIDISKQKELENKTLEALEKERELNEMKTNFISMASHEFRTPLTTILASIDLLDMYHKDWDDLKIKSKIERIQNAVFAMTGLLDEVLTLSRTDLGRISFDPIDLKISDFCTEILEQIKLQKLPNHIIKFNNRLLQSNIIADPKLLNHILINLLSNAIKYSPDGGEIVLTLVEEEEFIKFTVKDSGLGIPDDDKNKIFEPFFRAKNSVKQQGTGLGLSIVKNYVLIHQGEIWFESEKDKGTQFFVKLKKVYDHS